MGIRFARRLRKYLRGILASALYPMNSSILEGVNNRIKVIKRMAYRFRDADYFFLKYTNKNPRTHVSIRGFSGGVV